MNLETPDSVVFIIVISITIIAAATWKNAKGEGWGLAVFMGSLILGFNLSVTFAVWMLEALANLFGGMGDSITSATELGSGYGLIAVMIVLLATAWVMKKVKFDVVRIAALGTLYGILLRLLTDFLFWLHFSGLLGA